MKESTFQEMKEVQAFVIESFKDGCEKIGAALKSILHSENQ